MVTILTSFQLSANAYGLNQLRYDLRKLKGHALLQRDGSHYGWKGNYSVDGAAFVFIDNDSARIVTILGYPTSRIAPLG